MMTSINYRTQKTSNPPLQQYPGSQEPGLWNAHQLVVSEMPEARVHRSFSIHPTDHQTDVLKVR